MLLAVTAYAGGGYKSLVNQEVTDVTPVSRLSRDGKIFKVEFIYDLTSSEVTSNRMVVYTPMLIGDKDTLTLSSLGLLGRRRYFYYERNENRYPEVFENKTFRTTDMPDKFSWNEIMPYLPWMDGADLKLYRQVYGCCNKIIEEDVLYIDTFKDYHPVFKWVVPELESVKVRSLEGVAYIDFVVSTTDIRPEYRNNQRELGNIIGTIDSLKSDPDITMDTIYIKGFASPESPYDNNERLAKGRTLALKKYVTQLYDFDDNFIITSFEPEDWGGLRRFVEQSNIDNKASIIEIIDSDLDPDAKEGKIKTGYPDEYKFLLDVCYPALRHSDYRIVYNVRTYTDLKELKAIFKETPSKLSLRELFNLSTAYEPGTEEFVQIFEMAALLYPDNHTANLNAANAAMGVLDLDKAKRYLDKAGGGQEAIYARAVYWALLQDYAAAKNLFSQAASMSDNSEIQAAALQAADEMNTYCN